MKMNGISKVDTDALIHMALENERLERANDHLNHMIANIIQEIDAEADKWIHRTESWARPTSLDIELIAKAVGLDWDDYMANWNEEHKNYLEYFGEAEKNEE